MAIVFKQQPFRNVTFDIIVGLKTQPTAKCPFTHA